MGWEPGEGRGGEGNVLSWTVVTFCFYFCFFSFVAEASSFVLAFTRVVPQ